MYLQIIFLFKYYKVKFLFEIHKKKKRYKFGFFIKQNLSKKQNCDVK